MPRISSPCSTGDRWTSRPLPIPRTKSPINAPAIEMPIARAVGGVLYDGLKPADMVNALMARDAKSELHGLA